LQPVQKKRRSRSIIDDWMLTISERRMPVCKAYCNELPQVEILVSCGDGHQRAILAGSKDRYPLAFAFRSDLRDIIAQEGDYPNRCDGSQ
jgi:hypothetical protein